MKGAGADDRDRGRGEGAAHDRAGQGPARGVRGTLNTDRDLRREQGKVQKNLRGLRDQEAAIRYGRDRSPETIDHLLYPASVHADISLVCVKSLI